MYCGDETGSFIGDIGQSKSRFGYGGEDCPKAVFDSYLSEDLKSFPSSTLRPKKDIVSIFDHPSHDCINPSEYLNDGVISNFDAWESSWEHGFSQLSVGVGRHIPSSSTTTNSTMDTKCPHPLLAVDSGNTHHPAMKKSNFCSMKQRQKMVEILFEKFDAPSVFIAPAPMLQAFSLGRQTALVVDMGSGGCRVTPVVDGLLLKQTQRRNGMGGEWLSAMQYNLLRDRCNTAVTPRYLVRNTNTQIDKNLNDFCIREVMYEMKTGWHIRLPLGNDDDVEDEDKPVYELPDGTKIDLNNSTAGKDLIQLPNLLFCTNPFQDSQMTQPADISSDFATLLPMTPIHKLIHSSLSACDPDLRKELCGNIVLLGSHSLFPNLEKRLATEISNICPTTFKTRVLASKNSIERRFASWIGASVLTSLGSFQQLWLSRTEYDEYGVLLSCSRFP